MVAAPVRSHGAIAADLTGRTDARKTPAYFVVSADLVPAGAVLRRQPS